MSFLYTLMQMLATLEHFLAEMERLFSFQLTMSLVKNVEALRIGGGFVSNIPGGFDLFSY